MGERPDEIGRADLFDAEMIDRHGTVGENTEDAGETSDDTAEIRAGIEQTRSEMSETIDAIQDRLNPQHIKEQVKEQVREATIGRAEEVMRNAGDTLNEARYGLMETIRHNPILRQFFTRLVANGKAKRVALVAVMRKMLHVLNRLLADPNFVLVR